jgi:hypothetical protein
LFYLNEKVSDQKNDTLTAVERQNYVASVLHFLIQLEKKIKAQIHTQFIFSKISIFPTKFISVYSKQPISNQRKINSNDQTVVIATPRFEEFQVPVSKTSIQHKFSEILNFPL